MLKEDFSKQEESTVILYCDGNQKPIKGNLLFINFNLLLMRNLRLREACILSQGNTANKWRGHVSSSDEKLSTRSTYFNKQTQGDQKNKMSRQVYSTVTVC